MVHASSCSWQTEGGMLKHKVIGAFVAVWCAMCLLYMGARMALGTIMGAQGETSAVDVEKEPELVATEREATQEQELVTEPAPELEEDPLELESESVPESETAEEAQIADTPTLYEYLSQYTCGSCRRNCSLANPRCHNGSRLAEAKAQEYYDIYGQ